MRNRSNLDEPTNAGESRDLNSKTEDKKGVADIRRQEWCLCR